MPAASGACSRADAPTPTFGSDRIRGDAFARLHASSDGSFDLLEPVALTANQHLVLILVQGLIPAT